MSARCKKRILDAAKKVKRKLHKFFHAAYEWAHGFYSGRAVANALKSFNKRNFVADWVLAYVNSGIYRSLKQVL